MRYIYMHCPRFHGWPAIAFLKLDRTHFVFFLNRQPLRLQIRQPLYAQDVAHSCMLC